MEISTDEEECSLETTTLAATGTMEGGVRIHPTDLFDVVLAMSDLPEDSSNTEKLSKMMTAALRHKPGDFQIELQPDGFVRLETLAQSAQFRRLGATSRMLAAVVRSISKKRFIFTMRRGDIHVAATHGHSEGVLITQDTVVEISPSRAPATGLEDSSHHSHVNSRASHRSSGRRPRFHSTSCRKAPASTQRDRHSLPW